MTRNPRPVQLESPFAHPNPDTRRTYAEYRAAAMRDCLLRGDAPFASHALYTADGVLDDDIPAERALGIEAGFAWMNHAEAAVVYVDHGISRGMSLGIERAKSLNVPVEFRILLDGPLAEEYTDHRGDPISAPLVHIITLDGDEAEPIIAAANGVDDLVTALAGYDYGDETDRDACGSYADLDRLRDHHDHRTLHDVHHGGLSYVLIADPLSENGPLSLYRAPMALHNP